MPPGQLKEDEKNGRPRIEVGHTDPRRTAQLTIKEVNNEGSYYRSLIHIAEV